MTDNQTTRTIDVLDREGKKVDTIDLPGEIFDVPANIPLMHQVVVAQLAAARQGFRRRQEAVPPEGNR